jgi:RNA polymerase sigma factor (sigma-70 family)
VGVRSAARQDSMPADDSIILQKFADPLHQEEGFRLLLKKYQQKIYWHIRRMVIDHDDADDVVQDVFIKVWKNLASFRNDSALYTWLYRIATNEAITFLNRKKNRSAIPLDGLSGNLLDHLSDTPGFTSARIQSKLQQAIETLPDKQRLVFNMKYFDDLRYEEMSEILGTSVGALKASFHLAVKKIEHFLLTHD